MTIIVDALGYTANLVFKMGSVMAVSLLGMEILTQLGLLRPLMRLGRPLARWAHLPPESMLTFTASLGSMIAGHTMLADFYRQGRVSRRELLPSGVLNTVPLHAREILTYHFPVVLPLLGPRLCAVYILAFVLTGVFKLLFVVVYGRMVLAPHPAVDRRGPDGDGSGHLRRKDSAAGRAALKSALAARARLLARMLGILTLVTFVVQLLLRTGAMDAVERLLDPATRLLGLPPTVIGPLSVYVLSPTAGLTYMANLLDEKIVSGLHAIVALLAGGILMVPLMRLRSTLPRYIGIFGVAAGTRLCGVTMGFSIVARMLVLVGALIYGFGL